MIRIGITGPESSGKTALALALSQHFAADYVAEFARDFLQKSGGIYQQADLDTIARGQWEWMHRPSEAQLRFVDTEMLVMKIWSEFKYGTCSEMINELYSQQPIDLYLLCKPDIAWEPDPLREHPEAREELYGHYLRSLIEGGKRFEIVSGLGQARQAQAIQQVQSFLLENR